MEYVSYVTEVLKYHQFMFCIIKHNFGFNLRFNLMLCFDSQIHDENVSLRVNSEFQDRYLGEPLDIEFTYNRLEKSLHLSFHKCIYISNGNHVSYL